MTDIRQDRDVRWYKKKTWETFSLYIRLKYADVNGFENCVTCGAFKHYKEMQAGHFIQGRHNSILFDERNVHPQCYHCNIGLGGNQLRYYRFMQNKYGEYVVKELENLDLEKRQFTKDELIELRTRYKLLINEMKK